MIYSFQHPETGEVVDISMPINSVHEYIDENGVKWDRIWTRPYAAVDTKYDINNPKDYVAKTREKKGTLGSLFDEAAEASQKREEKSGQDPLKEKYLKDYHKKTGKKHEEQIRRETNNFEWTIKL